MSWTRTDSDTRTNLLVEGLRFIRKGALLMIVSYLLLGTGLILVLYILFMHAALPRIEITSELKDFTIIVERGSPWTSLRVSLTLTSPVVLVGLIFTGALVGLVGLYAYLVPGIRVLARAEPRYSTPASLMRIGFVWGPVLMIVGAILLLMVVSVLVLVAGLVLLLIGEIGLIVLTFYLYDSEKRALPSGRNILHSKPVPGTRLFYRLGANVRGARRERAEALGNASFSSTPSIASLLKSVAIDLQTQPFYIYLTNHS